MRRLSKLSKSAIPVDRFSYVGVGLHGSSYHFVYITRYSIIFRYWNGLRSSPEVFVSYPREVRDRVLSSSPSNPVYSILSQDEAFSRLAK